jgi:hypothetical protein
MRPPWTVLVRVARLAGRVTRAFGDPRDVPWVLDHRGRLFMLETSAV